jgi:DNA polymerase-3 subunit alpha
VVIAKDVLTKYSPLYRDPKTGAISTQFTMDIIEPCGLVKMDFLGLKTLTLIKHTIDLIHAGGKSFSHRRDQRRGSPRPLSSWEKGKVHLHLPV